MSYPFLSSPISGPRVKTHSLHRPRERGRDELGSGIRAFMGITADQLVLCGFWVMVGLKGAFTPEEPAQDGSREPNEGLGGRAQSG